VKDATFTATALDFQRRVAGVHGAAGEVWLRRLPALLEQAAARWSLRLLSPFEPLNYNYVAPGINADDCQVVLKAGVPGRLLRNEIAALRCYDRRGVVRLLAADQRKTVLLETGPASVRSHDRALARRTPGGSRGCAQAASNSSLSMPSCFKTAPSVPFGISPEWRGTAAERLVRGLVQISWLPLL
jgi:hypothetical protein